MDGGIALLAILGRWPSSAPGTAARSGTYEAVTPTSAQSSATVRSAS